MFRLIVVPALLATSVAAQELTYDATLTESCIATAPDTTKCIGRAAESCMEATPGGYSTLGVGACLSREAEWWDARLNVVYRQLTAQHRVGDAENASWGLPNPAMESSLRDMQRTWIAYRDATCDWERAQWGGGTGQGPAGAKCLMRLTGEQTLLMESRLEGRK